MSIWKTNTCPTCGKDFEKTTNNQIYCSEVCRVAAQYDIKEEPILPADVNLKVGEMLEIMQTLNITYCEYSKSIESRRNYIAKYKEVQNNGIV